MEWDKNIDILVEKYFEGETSLAEEKQLKHYFASQEVAPHLEQYRAIFCYFTQQQRDTFEKELVLAPQKTYPYRWFVAASIALLLGGGFWFTQQESNPPLVAQSELGTYDSPEKAFEETQKALAMVSGHLNTGIESMGYLNEYENSKNQVFKQ
ncbi:MAG: hypothetical protein RL607_2404 [Bacteroidota bacterium]|jgi:hypothetical protein